LANYRKERNEKKEKEKEKKMGKTYIQDGTVWSRGVGEGNVLECNVAGE
jgi:hypothetical protein